MMLAEKIRQKHAELTAQAKPEEKPVGPKTVREALAADGVSLKASYVKLVLWRDRKRKQQGPVRRQRRRPDPSGVNRSEKIRDLLKSQPDLTNAEIQAALAKDGIDVSMSLVKVVKHNLQKKKPATQKKKSTPKRRRPAPPDTNLSEEIRKLLGDHPDRRNTASIQEELAERGIDVSASLVKVVRHNYKKKLAAEKRRSEYVGDDDVHDLPPAKSASQQKKERQERKEKLEKLQQRYWEMMEMVKELEGKAEQTQPE